MFTYERPNYFERLVELHLAYAMRRDADRTGVMTIDQAIAWVEAEMAAVPTFDAQATTDSE